jgi:aminopeptidase-like protein
MKASHELLPLVEALYPICRSITGDGVRQTLGILGDWLPIELTEVPSGTPAFDWTVPDEWNIREAWIEDPAGRRIVDFRYSNLHVLNYSIPVDAEVDRETLDEHLYSLPEHPDWIPYRTSYYADQWGFCVPHRLRESLPDGRYRVLIDADRKPGSLTYGECRVPGELDSEILLYTHTCHPSLCNDNLSGLAVAAAVGARLLEMDKPRYSIRLVFGPGTIGSIVWLSRNRNRLDSIAHGVVIGLLGDDAPFTWKRSRTGTAEIDRVAAYVLGRRSSANDIIGFSPYGYDERQFGSPGIGLPVGRLTRSVNDGYPEYHSSADNMNLITEERLAESADVVMEILRMLDQNRYLVNQEPYCEPQLGRRGFYRTTGGSGIPDRESALLWLLNQCDGSNSLLDIAEKSGIGFESLVATAEELCEAGLLAE